VRENLGERSVTVWGKSYEVSIVRESKTVYRAVGTYEGEHIDVKGRSEGSALGLWRDAAQYRGNAGPVPPPIKVR
jgi:hypothetical protein